MDGVEQQQMGISMPMHYDQVSSNPQYYEQAMPLQYYPQQGYSGQPLQTQVRFNPMQGGNQPLQGQQPNAMPSGNPQPGSQQMYGLNQMQGVNTQQQGQQTYDSRERMQHSYPSPWPSSNQLLRFQQGFLSSHNPESDQQQIYSLNQTPGVNAHPQVHQMEVGPAN